MDRGWATMGFSSRRPPQSRSPRSATLTADSALVMTSVCMTSPPQLCSRAQRSQAPRHWTAGSLGVAAEITFNGYFYDHNPTLDLPATPYGTAYFGPNFQYVVVPEPTSVGCFLLGLGVFVCFQRLKIGRQI